MRRSRRRGASPSNAATSSRAFGSTRRPFGVARTRDFLPWVILLFYRDPRDRLGNARIVAAADEGWRDRRRSVRIQRRRANRTEQQTDERDRVVHVRAVLWNRQSPRSPRGGDRHRRGGSAGSEPWDRDTRLSVNVVVCAG